MNTSGMHASFDAMLGDASEQVLTHVYGEAYKDRPNEDFAGLADNLCEFAEITSWIQRFNSTAGPFRGIAGAAMTNFRVSVVDMDGLSFIFIGGKLARVFDGSAEPVKALVKERKLPLLSSLEEFVVPWSPSQAVR